MDEFDRQVEAIMLELYGERVRFTQWASIASIDGVGLFVGHRFMPSRQVRFSVWVGSAPYGTQLLDLFSDINSRLWFGAVSALGTQETRIIQVYYDFMRPWVNDCATESSNVSQALLDIIGNLPMMGQAVQAEILARAAGTTPDLSEDWDLFFQMFEPAGQLGEPQ